MVMVELDICYITATLPPKEEILGLMVQYMGVVLNRSTTCRC